MTNDFPIYEQRTAEILGRYTVPDLIEQTDADLDRADRLFYASAIPVEVIESGHVGLVDFWKIKSGEKLYEVRRFKNFCFCSCRDWFFRKRACKHIAITASVYCSNCRQLRAHKEKLCVPCYDERYRFYKPSDLQEKNNERTIAGS